MDSLRLLFTLILSFLPAGNSDLTTDKAALLRLSSAVRGRTLQWNQSDPTPCLWKGVTCDNTTVTALRLPGCALSGQIPPNSIGNLTQLRNLSLGRNSLSGALPPDLGSCTELRFLFLQENQFSGEIPATLFGLKNLIRLSLAGNKFSGEISRDFNNLTMLRALYLENNQLTGSLPELDNLSALRIFNVSFNSLNGSIPPSLTRFSPESFLGNSLCNSPLNSCPSDGNTLSGGAIAGIVIGSVFGLILILFVSFILWRKYKSTSILPPVMSPMPPSPVKPPEFKIRSPNPIIVIENHELDNGFSGIDTGRRVPGNVIRNGDDGLVYFGHGVRTFNLEELLMASAETLGKGTFGTTYKAYLEGVNGGEVIVKRLRNVFVGEREFREKVEKLGVLVHENLVPPRAYYYGKEEKLLVYDWMPMGSLSALLHGNRAAERSLLTWEARSRIAFQAALGIEYLHSLGPNVTHGSIKSSNIFLTDQYGACVSEFGITQLVSSTSTPNLIGYRAPELMDSHKISQKADVYSFGVVLLELLTGKSETNALNEEGVELARWVESVVEEKWSNDVFDPELPKYQNIEEQMVQLLHLAIYCTSQDPEKRPSMADVIRQIKKICGSRQQR